MTAHDAAAALLQLDQDMAWDSDGGDSEPTGITVSVCGSEGSVRQTQTGFGRSVHLADRAAYKIAVTNDRKDESGKRERVAIQLTVDGRKVSPTPILVGKERTVDGFTQSRNVRELEAKGAYLITKEVGRFVAVKGDTEQPGPHNGAIGTITCEFFATKTVRLRPGNHTRRHPGQPVVQGQARDGVMRTESGPTYHESGMHVRHDTKPLADKARRLGCCKLTICEQQVPSLGDWTRM